MCADLWSIYKILSIAGWSLQENSSTYCLLKYLTWCTVCLHLPDRDLWGMNHCSPSEIKMRGSSHCCRTTNPHRDVDWWLWNPDLLPIRQLLLVTLKNDFNLSFQTWSFFCSHSNSVVQNSILDPNHLRDTDSWANTILKLAFVL